MSGCLIYVRGEGSFVQIGIGSGVGITIENEPGNKIENGSRVEIDIDRYKKKGKIHTTSMLAELRALTTRTRQPQERPEQCLSGQLVEIGKRIGSVKNTVRRKGISDARTLALGVAHAPGRFSRYPIPHIDVDRSRPTCSLTSTRSWRGVDTTARI
ncbi:hypothetical protein EVAR_103184_1 [Eumeta japonica]|uniref:Uncharacterized protein n=1 Tax=Eumeta variegata TaxID=151549 RepID=A0A4C1YG07_EUMVA|nr:hypothetical protein EVAR_103184_1 [Eumeta japonica]